MKLTVEFKDHDEYDELVKDLAKISLGAAEVGHTGDIELFLSILVKLLEGEIVEG